MSQLIHGKRDKEIIELHNAGETFQAIAKRFGLSRQRIWGICRHRLSGDLAEDKREALRRALQELQSGCPAFSNNPQEVWGVLVESEVRRIAEIVGLNAEECRVYRDGRGDLIFIYYGI